WLALLALLVVAFILAVALGFVVAFILAVALGFVVGLGILAHRLGDRFGGLGDLVLGFLQVLGVHPAAFGLGADDLLLPAHLVDHLHDPANALLLGFELGLAIIAHEQGQDGPDILGEHLAAFHRLGDGRDVGCLGRLEEGDELVETSVDLNFAR